MNHKIISYISYIFLILFSLLSIQFANNEQNNDVFRNIFYIWITLLTLIILGINYQRLLPKSEKDGSLFESETPFLKNKLLYYFLICDFLGFMSLCYLPIIISNGPEYLERSILDICFGGDIIPFILEKPIYLFHLLIGFNAILIGLIEIENYHTNQLTVLLLIGYISLGVLLLTLNFYVGTGMKPLFYVQSILVIIGLLISLKIIINYQKNKNKFIQTLLDRSISEVSLNVAELISKINIIPDEAERLIKNLIEKRHIFGTYDSSSKIMMFKNVQIVQKELQQTDLKTVKTRLIGMIKAMGKLNVKKSAELLQKTQDEILNLLFELVGENKIAGKMEGDDFIIQSNIEEFTAILDQQFQEWENAEQTKIGKI